MTNSKWNFFGQIALTRRSSFGAILGMIVCLLLGANELAAQKGKKADAPLWEKFDRSNFDENSHMITNDWEPFKPGTRMVYAGTTLTDEDEPVPHRVIINVTDLVKEIDGVKCLVTYDLDYSQGALVEAEIAFYAQDKDGTVWRMGEYPEEYDEEGNIDDAPCWLSGVRDARAGVAMLANPFVEMEYSQGWGPDVDFTDRAEIYQMGERICNPYDCFEGVLVIAETSLDEVGIYQLKYFAPGVGNIQVGYKGDDPSAELLELVDITEMGEKQMEEVRKGAFKLEKNAYDNRKTNRVFGPTKPMQRVN